MPEEENEFDDPTYDEAEYVDTEKQASQALKEAGPSIAGLVRFKYGGWLSPRIVDDFTSYADVCFREFGDRVAHWITILEPNILAQGSYDNGIVPPGRCSYPFGRDCAVGNSSVEPYLFLHNSLLAHSSAVRLYREKLPRRASWA
ncbi:hypothetical protein ACP70R_035250 [Stipagrostis hirtigluma subsp. patula]